MKAHNARNRQWTADEDAKLRSMYKAGASYKYIAYALDRPYSSIGSRIYTLCLPRRQVKGRAA